MRIHIKDLTFKTIIGILDEERLTPQRVVLHVKIVYDYDGKNFINYADVCSFLEDEMNAMKYYLIEDALENLSQKLKNLYPMIQKLTLKILKPDIIPNATVGLSQHINYVKN